MGYRQSKPMTEERFFRHVERQPNGCWRWTGAGKGNGYGVAAHAGRVVSVHRIAYEMFVGQILAGAHIDHTCHGADQSCVGGQTCLHRRCVNPAHLEAVSVAENLRRGRGFVARQVLVTHCPQGHPYDERNTSWFRNKRGCRACDRERHATRRALRSAA